MKSTATIPTVNAHRYMTQLCKHFAHEVPTTFDDHEGKIAFEMGEAALRASPDTLMLVATAEDVAALERLETVVASHLTRFAFREPEMSVEWSRAV